MALRLAEALNGVVVNADSMQVYHDLRVITARPTPEEETRVPHRLFGTVDGAQNYSVGTYVSEAATLLVEIQDRGQIPILVGGTGLYFSALTTGLSEIPTVSDEVRSRVRASCEGRDTPALHVELARRDPVMAGRLHPNDRLRIMRALEVHAQTGQSVSVYQGVRRAGILNGSSLVKLFLMPERALIQSRIDRRFLDMMAMGALDEVAALRERCLDPMLPVMRAHGVPGLVAYLNGSASLDEAIARGQSDTRAYAKRQMTWFRHQMGDWTGIRLDETGAMIDQLVRSMS